MPILRGALANNGFLSILNGLIAGKRTGYLKIRQGDQQGMLAVENGTIMDAEAGSYTGLHALFDFVGWREADFSFQEKSLPAESSRDLAVYDAQMLLAGISSKAAEHPG